MIPAAVLAAGIAYAAPAHALPITHWEGSSPNGGMIVIGHGIVHAQVDTTDGKFMHMTSANGCDENWWWMGPETIMGDDDHAFARIDVNAGRGVGCQPTPGGPAGSASVDIRNEGGGNYLMTVIQTPQAGTDPGVSWVLHGHDG